MLTSKEIGNFIAHPEAIRSEHLEDLHQLTDKYPYAQLFSMLYLRGLSANNSVDFEAALKQHSFRISDRAQLYRLIHDHENDPTPVQQTEESLSDTGDHSEESISTPLDAPATFDAPEAIQGISEEAPEPQTSPIAEVETSSIEIVVEPEDVQEDEVAEEQITTPTQEAQDDTIITPDETPEATEIAFEVSTEEETTPEIEIPGDALEESILHHAVANNYQLEELTPEEEAAMEERISTSLDAQHSDLDAQVGEIDAPGDGVHVQSNESGIPQNQTPDRQEEIETPEVRTEEEHLSIDTKQSFTGWLRSDTNYSEPDSSDEASIHAVVDDFSEFDPMESLFGEVEKPKKEFFSPTKKAKESLREDQLPVSETLAKIYIMQGNYPKAIAAYEELSLSFPEKKIFFANLIEDLQKKLNR